MNGHVSNWADFTAEVPQETILGPLLLLVYINDLATGLSSNVKLFVEDTSFFSVPHDMNTSVKKLNNELAKISDLV